MLFATACNKSNDAIDNENTGQKGYTIPVTVNVTRQGDDPTKATYNETSKKLEFSADDKLFVSGVVGGYDYEFAGTLDYVPATEKFSGTIYTSKEWTGTADALFTAAIANPGYIIATLLPAGYESYGYLYIQTYNDYNDEAALNNTYTLATSKAAGVEQFSYEKATSYSSGFALAPQNAILNFTITGLAASTNVAVALTGSGYNITKTVTTDGSGNATFGAGVENGTDLNSLTLTVAGNPITLVSEEKLLAAGKIYNITRNAIPGALIGQFSVSSTKKVYFSKGNLQYQASPSPTWRFAEHQYDYVGDASKGNVYVESVKSNNASISSSYTGWIDLFGWGTGDNPTKTSTNYNEYGSFTDWGSNAISNGGNEAGTWRTLTGGSGGEWEYLFKTRTTVTTNMPTGNNSGSARYTKATVAGVSGVILFPDNYAHPAGVTVTVSDASYNTDSKNYTTFTVDASNWVTMQSAGCVFLPAAGFRNNGSTVSGAGSGGHYWSSSPYTSDVAYACYVSISSDGVNPANKNNRERGRSVRLVHDAN